MYIRITIIRKYAVGNESLKVPNGSHATRLGLDNTLGRFIQNNTTF